MKKLLFGSALVLSLIFSPGVQARGGGSSFAGGLAGGMMGGIISGAMTKDSGGRRVEEVRHQQQESQIRDIREGIHRRQTGTTTNLIIFALFIMFLVVLGMFFMIFKMKNKKLLK